MPRESREESITSAEADGAREVGGGSAAAHARRSLPGALGRLGSTQMDDEVNETSANYSSLSNEDLDEIAQARYAQYNSEAVRSAREELRRRGIDWQQRAADWAASLEEPIASARPSGWWWKVWPTLCALTGITILIM